ncbi:hypothetical protein Scep_020302 [Stephania cephalantha]|uniref:Uncharacterized protein n=1 Tax=Stephania cephalantha TaxID=152367 RepID=A0AAP0ICH2_9MAGN
MWCSSLLKELGFSQASCPVMWCDNTSAKSLASNLVFHARTKHIEVDAHFIREKLLAGVLELRYVPTEHQSADLLTKMLSVSRFRFLLSKLHLVSSPRFHLRGHVSVRQHLSHIDHG